MARYAAEDAMRMLETKKIKEAAVYILYGEDEYLISEVMRLLRSSIVDADFGDFNYTRLECNGSTKAAELVNALRELPMLADKRLLELHFYQNIAESTVKKIEKTFKETLQEGSTVICLVSHNEAKKSKSKLITWSQDFAQEINCSVSTYNLPRWVELYLKEKGCKFKDSKTAQELQNRVGTNLLELSSQLDQLVLYVGDKKIIDIEDVRLVIHQSNEVKVWEYTKALTQKDYKKAMQTCASLLEDNAQRGSLTLIAFTNKYLRDLAQALDVTSKYGFNLNNLAQQMSDKKDFQINYLLKDLRNWKEINLRDAFHSLCQADLRLKTGGDPLLTMQLLTLRIVGRR